MKIKVLLLSSLLLTTFLTLVLVSTASANSSYASPSSHTATDCSWVGVSVKDCVVFEGLGDLEQTFQGSGRYAVRYLDTAGWSGFNLYRAFSYAYGASSITVTDVNGVDMTDLYQISYGTYSTATGIPVGQVSSDVILIYDVVGIGSNDDVRFSNACSWTGWC